MGIFDSINEALSPVAELLTPAKGSQWNGLNPHLIATFYPVIAEGEGKDRRFVKKGTEIVKAPILEGAEIEYTLNWQSPFEQMGTEAKAPALTAMLQSGMLTNAYAVFSSFRGAGEAAPEQASQNSNAIHETLKSLEGRTGITKLNSTQTFAGMPPIKCTMKLLFRAYQNAQVEVMQPIETLIKWAVPTSLSPDGTLVNIVEATQGKEQWLDVLMPSISPTLVAMEYKGRIYSPMVIESISDPITSPTTSDGKYAKAEVSLTIASLSAWDRNDIQRIYSGGLLNQIGKIA